MTPSIGRIVHVTIGGSCKGAMVAHVWSGQTINVGGFDQNGQPFARTSVPQGEGEGNWHWPERVEEGRPATPDEIAKASQP
ncbi:MAG TPA: hypothetical protein VK600_00350 [Candidatus Saccharimonadales bacterium]|nr:hypothetical protein [Candidatus Saccharimonadales bacterium]